jgi:pimeloyl-ACP methyl ester carboxylesterase
MKAAWFAVGASVLLTSTSSAGQGGHRVRVAGSGAVTVVFEAGLGDTLEVWQHVQPRVADCARTFAYNRAGYPGSPRAAGERDAARITEELRGELRARGLRPPYLLAGHSLGGLYMQYFARRHPEEVLGLVLIDATHWQNFARLRAANPGTWRTLEALSLLMTPIMRRELAGAEAAGRQVHEAPAASTPAIVLSSTRAAPGEVPSLRELLRRLQAETAASNATRRHEFVADSSHYIQRDQPEAVIRAIRELAGCR